MKITGVEEQKKNSRRCNIYIDSEYYCSADRDILAELNISEGMEFDEDKFGEILETLQYKSALRSALYMLARASKTEKEIKKKLQEKKYPDSAITKTLDYLKKINYINDKHYAESFIRSMRDVSGISSRIIYRKLFLKGIDADIIQKALDEADINDYESAIKAARKKTVSLKGESSEKKSKLLNFLYRKGFDIDICRKAVEEVDIK